MKNKIAILLAVIITIIIAVSIFGDATPGQPTNTQARRALILYNNDVGHNQVVYNRFITMLVNTFQYTVETIPVPSTFNKGAGLTYVTGASAVTRAALAITPANYCIIIDMRFCNQNIPAGSGPVGTNYIQGDTITQGDVTQYSNYLNAGGALMITGDNFYSAGTATYDGFISRQENMNRVFNALTSHAGWLDTCFQVGPAVDTLGFPGTNWSLLETDWHNMTGLTESGLDYSGFLPASCITAAEHVFAIHNGDATKSVGIAWDEAGLASSNPNAKMVYIADNSFLNNNTNGGVTWNMMENAIDYLHNDTCCTAPSDLCFAGPQVNDATNNPIISCFQSGANGYTTPGSWTTTWDFNSVGGGSLMWSGSTWDKVAMFTVTAATADAAVYDRICFTLRNTGANSATVYLRANSTGGTDVTTTPSFTVPAGTTQSFCASFAVPHVSMTSLMWVLYDTANNPYTMYLDAVYMRHSCGTKPDVIDGECCILTATPTPTVTNTPTSTPTVVIQITKTIDKTVARIGDNIQYCFNYTNPSATNPYSFQLWDTIPAVTDFVSCTGGCATATFSGNVVASWTINLAAGASSSVCLTVRVARFPYLEWFRQYLAVTDEWLFLWIKDDREVYRIAQEETLRI